MLCRSENFEREHGQFPDGLRTATRRREVTRQRPRAWFLKERAKIKHACINRECQSPLGEQTRGEEESAFIFLPLIPEVYAMQRPFSLWTFMWKHGDAVWKLLSLISTRIAMRRLRREIPIDQSASCDEIISAPNPPVSSPSVRFSLLRNCYLISRETSIA